MSNSRYWKIPPSWFSEPYCMGEIFLTATVFRRPFNGGGKMAVRRTLKINTWRYDRSPPKAVKAGRLGATKPLDAPYESSMQSMIQPLSFPLVLSWFMLTYPLCPTAFLTSLLLHHRALLHRCLHLLWNFVIFIFCISDVSVRARQRNPINQHYYSLSS